MLKVQRVFILNLFFSLTFSLAAHAKFDVINQNQKLNLPQQVEAPSQVSQFSDRVGSNLNGGDTSQVVLNKMLDNSFGYLWDNSGLRNTSVGQAMQKVETKMKADVSLGSTNSESTSKTEHKISFRVLAAQALAKIEYFGWFKAALKYDVRNSASVAEVSENIANNKDLVVSNINTKEENRSQISLRWDW